MRFSASIDYISFGGIDVSKGTPVMESVKKPQNEKLVGEGVAERSHLARALNIPAVVPMFSMSEPTMTVRFTAWLKSFFAPKQEPKKVWEESPMKAWWEAQKAYAKQALGQLHDYYKQSNFANRMGRIKQHDFVSRVQRGTITPQEAETRMSEQRWMPHHGGFVEPH